MRRPRQEKVKKALTGADVARMLGVSYGMVVNLPIPRFEVKSGTRTFRRYQEEEVLKYIEANTKTA